MKKKLLLLLMMTVVILYIGYLVTYRHDFVRGFLEGFNSF